MNSRNPIKTFIYPRPGMKRSHSPMVEDDISIDSKKKKVLFEDPIPPEIWCDILKSIFEPSMEDFVSVYMLTRRNHTWDGWKVFWKDHMFNMHKNVKNFEICDLSYVSGLVVNLSNKTWAIQGLAMSPKFWARPGLISLHLVDVLYDERTRVVLKDLSLNKPDSLKELAIFGTVPRYDKVYTYTLDDILSKFDQLDVLMIEDICVTGDFLSHLKNIRSFSITFPFYVRIPHLSMRFNLENLIYIPQHFESLRIDDSYGNIGLKDEHIMRFDRLKCLRVCGCCIALPEIIDNSGKSALTSKVLKHFPKLTILEISATKNVGTVFPIIPRNWYPGDFPESLERISLTGIHMGERCKDHIAPDQLQIHCPKLKSLRLWNSSLFRQSDDLSQITNLQTLEIIGCGVHGLSTDCFKPLLKCINLKSITIDLTSRDTGKNGPTGPIDISILQYCPYLEEISLTLLAYPLGKDDFCEAIPSTADLLKYLKPECKISLFPHPKFISTSDSRYIWLTQPKL